MDDVEIEPVGFDDVVLVGEFAPFFGPCDERWLRNSSIRRIDEFFLIEDLHRW